MSRSDPRPSEPHVREERGMPRSPGRSATSPSSATAGRARPRSSRRCSSRPGAINRLGTVEAGTTVSRLGRGRAASGRCRSRASLAHLEWQGRKINLIDTPGDSGFQADTIASAPRRRGRARRRLRRDGRRGEHGARLGPRRGARALARRLRQHARPRARRLLPRRSARCRSSSPTAASRSSCRSAPSTS